MYCSITSKFDPIFKICQGCKIFGIFLNSPFFMKNGLAYQVSYTYHQNWGPYWQKCSVANHYGADFRSKYKQKSKKNFFQELHFFISPIIKKSLSSNKKKFQGDIAMDNLICLLHVYPTIYVYFILMSLVVFLVRLQ